MSGTGRGDERRADCKMTPEFLLLANLVLLLRLRLLLTDAPAGTIAWTVKALIELLSLGLFVPHGLLIGSALVTLAANVAGSLWDRHRGERNAGHLILGVLHLIALSVLLSRAGGVVFRPELLIMVQHLGTWSTFGFFLTGLFDLHALKIGFGLLLAANEANLAIRAVLGGLQLKPGRTGGTAIDVGEYNRGRVIGLLERVLIYCFVLSGQFGAIGFTLAAKGFTRFKELEDRGFAEYVLIGTLLSSGLAMGVGVLVRFGL